MRMGAEARGCGTPLLSSTAHADVAQLVEHHLAKVRVAGSNPVVRSTNARVRGPFRGPLLASRAGDRRGSAVHGFRVAKVAVSVVSPPTTMSWEAAFPSDHPTKTYG